MSGGRFIERWSRLKKAAEKAGDAASAAPPPDAEALLAGLGPDGDFTVFLREEIGEEVRRQAMKKLFADPHFNVMDGLDVYIDDYSIADPIPEEMLAALNQARSLLFDEPPPASPAVEAAADCDNLAGAGQNVAASPPSAPDTTGNQ